MPVIDIGRFAAHQFERADHAGGARQLIEREQAQRVAHDHSHSGAEDTRVSQPTVRDRKGREPEIGFGLAAAGREEQEVDGFPVGMRLVDQPRKVQEDESELEGPPARWPFRAAGSNTIPGLLETRAIAARRRAARATASFMIRKARRALSSVSRIPIPARMRASAARIPSTRRRAVPRRRPGYVSTGSC